MSKLTEAKNSLGELLLTGVAGYELEDSSAAFLSQSGIGGVILFAHNYESPAQMAEFTNQIQETRGSRLPLWIAVDHEGGKVQRFRKGFTRIPEAAQIGASDSPKLAFEISEMMAKELKAVGINLNFAPVADIATHPKNPVIGPRAFGETEERVSKMVTAMVRGHLVSGVQPCVKHFPGHGDTSTDSHFALPKVDVPLETLAERELKPFVRAFKSRCEMVMTAHILNPKLDQHRPATLSARTLQEILRGQLRFRGVIVSDDMEMKAITEHYGVDEAPLLAIQAGCDLLCYRTEAAARHAYEVLLKALDEEKLTAERVLESVQRLRALKKDALQRYEAASISDVGKVVGLPEHQALIDRVPGASGKN